jgi:hypothetical protein
MNTRHRLAFTLLTFALLSGASAESEKRQSQEQVLFGFDDHALPLRQGMRMQLVPYRTPLGDIKSPNLVLGPGKPGTPDSAGTCYYPGTVCQVGDELWMWYAGMSDQDERRGSSRLCLAKSKDGIHWERPNLGLVKFNGNKDNNLIEFKSGRSMHTMGAVIFYEPDSPDESKRFKMAFIRGPGLNVAYSPDGMRWTESPDNPRTKAFIEPSGGVKWKGAYYVNGQGILNWSPDGYGTNRMLGTHISYDFENWTEATVMGFRRDSLAPRPITRTGNRDGEQVHVGAALWNRENVIIGFYGQWHGHPNNDLRWVSIDIGLVISHDAMHFSEPIPDFRMIEAAGSLPWFQPYAKQIPIYRAPAITQGQGFANVGDKTLFWFGIWGSPGEGIHVAQWKRDRLGYLQPFVSAKKRPHVISTPVSVSGKDHRIKLNISGLSEDAGVKVALLDEQFRPIPGYTAAECLGPSASGLRELVTWTKGAAVEAATFRVRIDFTGAEAAELRLYAVYIDSEK